MTPFSVAGSLHGTTRIDPGPSGGGSLLFGVDILIEAFGGNSGVVTIESVQLAGGGSVDGIGTGALAFGGDASIEGFSGGNGAADIDFLIQASGLVAVFGQGSVMIDGAAIEGSGKSEVFSLSAAIEFSAMKVSGKGSTLPHGSGTIRLHGAVSGTGHSHLRLECQVHMNEPVDMSVMADGWLENIADGVVSIAEIAAIGRGWIANRFEGVILRFADEP